MPHNFKIYAVADWGMGDALNLRAFLHEYSGQKHVPRSQILVFSRPAYSWMFQYSGFRVLRVRTKPRARYSYRNFGGLSIPKTSSNPHQDLCLAESAGIRYTYDSVALFPGFRFPDGITLPDQYVTLNTGVGQCDPGRVRIKAWPREYWEKLVRLLDIPVVQIGGGPSCCHVDGVVADLRDRLSITESAEVMRRGLFHIDIEGGLPILNQHLGKKSVVLFGPTHPDQQGRSYNINLRSTDCPSCYEWGTYKYWNLCVHPSRLPCGAHCMRDLDPEYVAGRIRESGWLDNPQRI